MVFIDFDKMFVKIKVSQWVFVDIDWDVFGVDKIIVEQWFKLKVFMVDLMWIEYVGVWGFVVMVKKVFNDMFKEIYIYFYVEEQCYVNVEMVLMKCWGMFDGDNIFEFNKNLKLVIQWLDCYSDDMFLEVLGLVILMLEIVLDGVFCIFLLEIVDDLVCYQVFVKINDDEFCYLGVGFYVLEMQGYGLLYLKMLKVLGIIVDLCLIFGVVFYVLLFNWMCDNIIEMGFGEECFYVVMRKFEWIGGCIQEGCNNFWYQIISCYGWMVVNCCNCMYYVLVDVMVKFIDCVFEWVMLFCVLIWVKGIIYKLIV